jgi:micrococcal nuclease
MRIASSGACVALAAIVTVFVSGAPVIAQTPAPTRTPVPTRTPRPTPTPVIEEATLVEVVDGDEIRVKIGAQTRTVSVRYLGIDAPEPAQGTRCFSKEAREFNQSVLQGTLRLEKDRSNRDQFGRLLRYVFLADGRMVNEEMLKLGLARLKNYPADRRYQARFKQAADDARKNEIGLWGACYKKKATPTPRPTPTPRS